MGDKGQFCSKWTKGIKFCLDTDADGAGKMRQNDCVQWVQSVQCVVEGNLHPAGNSMWWEWRKISIRLICVQQGALTREYLFFIVAKSHVPLLERKFCGWPISKSVGQLITSNLRLGTTYRSTDPRTTVQYWKTFLILISYFSVMNG